jgi:TolB-like protein
VAWLNQNQVEAMVEQPETVATPTAAEQLADESADRKKKKKKDKVRSAWISFVGRIIAQMMGAAATISLGLMVVQKYAPETAQAVSAPAAPVLQLVRLATPGEASLAVLPLQNISADGEGSFAKGMTDTLITYLARHEDIHVVSRTSAMQFREPRPSVPEIARALGVNFVLDGSVIKADGRVRITAHLIDARRDEHIWVDSYERPLREVLTVQAEVANAIAAAVRMRIATPVLVRQ